MLILTPRPLAVKDSSVLHLIHPRMNKDAEVIKVLSATVTNRKQIIFPGNTNLEANVFRAFNTVVINDISPKSLSDWVKRLEQYKDLLREVIDHPTRRLIVIGNSILAMSPQLLYIPTTRGIVYNTAIISPEIIRDTPGLNLIPFYVDLFGSNTTFAEYRRNAAYAATKHKPLFVFTSNTVWNSNGKHTGTIYQYEVNGKLSEVKDKEKLNKTTEVGNVVKEAKALYAEDFDENGYLIE